MDRKIVVVGSGGQLGGQLCRTWGEPSSSHSENGSDACRFDRERSPEVIGLDLPEFDLTDREVVLDKLCKLGPHIVVNTAAYTEVDRAEVEPERCLAVNGRGVTHLVEACRRLDASLVQISTDYVFGREADRRSPYRETDQPGPLGVYGRSKLEGEKHAAGWEKHLIVRTAGLYGKAGPRSVGNFPQTILRLARKGRPLRVVNDQHVTTGYVPHVARAIRFLVETGARGVFHVVNQGATTWFDFSVELLRLANLDVEPEPVTTTQYAASLSQAGWVERSEAHQKGRKEDEARWSSLRSPHPTLAPRPKYSVLSPGKYLDQAGRPDLPSWQAAVAEYAATEIG